MEILRNLYRRRLRTGLTILGIAVGILAFTVMGGMAEKINMMIEGGEAYFARRIAVRSAGGIMQVDVMTQEDIAAMERVDGVQTVETHIMLPLEEDTGFDVSPRFMVGIDLENFLRAQDLAGPRAALRFRMGGWWLPGEKQVAVVGSAVATRMKLGLGDVFTIRGRSFKVVGLLEETLSLPDGWAYVPQGDARDMVLSDSKLLEDLKKEAFVTNAYAVVDPTRGEEIVAAMAREMRRGFLLYSPQQMTRAAGQVGTVLNTAILGSGAIAVVVGALSVINTMFIAVGERTREIGIKKAIGANRGDILMEFLQEATFMGILGGILGVVLGAGVIAAINWYSRGQGTPIFLLTPRLALWAMSFAALLGTAAGILPALRAASLDPVEALRQL